MPNTQRIDVKQAFAAAKQFYLGLFPNRALGVQLEEVEPSKDGKYWLVTLSYQPTTVRQVLQQGLPPKGEYKVFQVDAANGKVISMKIRNPGNGEH